MGNKRPSRKSSKFNPRLDQMPGTPHPPTHTHTLSNTTPPQDLEGISITLHKDMGKTHTILCEVRGSTVTSDKHTVFMYAHLDKMPPLDPALWAPGLHPYIPLIKDDKLFGRGSSDDGYGIYIYIYLYIYISICILLLYIYIYGWMYHF